MKKILMTGTSKDKAYKQADFVVIAISTNYDPIKKSFNTASIDHVIEDAVSNKKVSKYKIDYPNRLFRVFKSKV